MSHNFGSGPTARCPRRRTATFSAGPFISLSIRMRGRMSDGPSYAAPVNIGDVMGGHNVSEVVESRHPGFTKGDVAAGYDD